MVDAIAAWLSEPTNIRSLEPTNEIGTIDKARGLARTLNNHTQETAGHIRKLVSRIACDGANLTLSINRSSLEDLLRLDQSTVEDPITIEQPCQFVRRGKAHRLILQSDTPSPNFDPALAKAILRARGWFEKLKTRQTESITELARIETLPRAWISQQLPLAFLSPSILERVAAGRQPATLTVEKLVSIASQSADWEEQQTAALSR